MEDMVLVDPASVERIYLDCLNRSFGHWGDSNLYNWCFQRKMAGVRPDMMIINKGDQAVAGSAVTYRRVRAGPSKIRVGIMTGSWTVPETRGEGCFARIIKQSVSVARDKRAALLIAFIVKTNPSLRGLIHAGASLFPTYYVVSNQATPKPDSAGTARPVMNAKEGRGIILRRLRAAAEAGSVHFDYSAAEWQSQFLDRPAQIEFLAIDPFGLAVIEKHELFDRILALSLESEDSFGQCMKVLVKRALTEGRRIFFFTTSTDRNRECEKLGLESSAGCLTALVANQTELAKAFPDPLNQHLDAPDRVWPFGKWEVNTGDRM